MIDNIVFVRELNARLKYLPNKNDNSFYKTYKMQNGGIDRQIRVSSHGTYLKFWIEQDYDPSFGINISIAFTENGIPTNDCHIDNSTNEPYKDCRPCLVQQELQGTACKPRRVHYYNQKKRPFSVTQYVYNCQNFDGTELNACIDAIKNAAQTGDYTDPFVGVDGKEAIKVTLQPIEENKQNINCNLNMNKNRIRLTESQLHRVIKESVKKVLKEAYADHPFNFFFDDDFNKEPTHRIDLFYYRGGDVSSPAIFSSDEEAIQAAIKEANAQGGVCGIKVERYSGEYDDNGYTSLETIYEKGETY